MQEKLEIERGIEVCKTFAARGDIMHLGWGGFKGSSRANQKGRDVE